MSTDLDKLNRLRTNAGKNPLKVWKASQPALLSQIKRFEEEGFTDALPGANVEVKPKTEDPEIKAVLDSDPPKPLKDSALANNVAKTPAPTVEPRKVRAHLARGLDTDTMARNSRLAVQQQREQEKRDKKKQSPIKLSKEDKKQIKEEAADRKIVGKVDAKKDPDKAKRQIDKVNAKQAARAGKPKKESNDNEITVAEIARELNIDPKVARAKLRRHEAKISKLHTKGQDRWTFPKSAKSELVKILKGGK